ncbi:lectin like domain-containing protein, partial [Ureaplasma zalophigenitalium]
MYISYETNISETFTFNYVNKNKYDNNYYYDGFLKDIYNVNETTAAVSFTTKRSNDKNDEFLKAVNVGFDGKNVDVTVKVYVEDDGDYINPFNYVNHSPSLKATKTMHFDDGGLRTIELDKEIKLAPHQRFSIVASVKNDKNDAKIKFSDEEFS